jgi:hypothetical protein
MMEKKFVLQMDGVERQKRLCDLRAAYDAAPPGSAKQFCL